MLIIIAYKNYLLNHTLFNYISYLLKSTIYEDVNYLIYYFVFPLNLSNKVEI